MTALAAVLERARGLGFLGPGPIDDHLAHARAMARVVERAFGGRVPGGRFVDLGAGGGIPGLVLACEWPATSWVLVESMHRRSRFLAEAVDELDLRARVEVANTRAEVLGRDPAYRGQSAVVVSRSFGPPSVTAECGAPFLREGGRLVVSEPPETEASSTRWPAQGLALLGLVATGRELQGGVSFEVLKAVSACPERFPRRTGVPAKRPLF